MAKAQKAHDWERLSDQEILQMRVRDLKIQIQGSELQPMVERLYEELDRAGIGFHPPCYLADEWLCPDKVPIIGIAFCLAHSRLRQIEQKMMYEIEGGTQDSCMQLLRHECGHALNYAYEFYKRTRWRQLFGCFSARYSDAYYFEPYSRRYVTHLKDSYAQAHPDEDFAETFAVWLNPNSRWQEKYRRWPVIKKLRYVDTLMGRIGPLPPKNTAQEHPPWSAARMTSTLAAHYQRKRKALGDDFQGFYDESLRALFAAEQDKPLSQRASRLLRRRRRDLVDSVTRWTEHRKYDIHQLVNTLIQRCDALDLYSGDGEVENLIGITALLTAIASNTLGPVRRGKR